MYIVSHTDEQGKKWNKVILLKIFLVEKLLD